MSHCSHLWDQADRVGGEPSDLCAGLGLTWCGTVVPPGLWVDRPAGPLLILPLAFRVALGKLPLAPRSVCFLVSTASEVSQEHLLTQTGAKFASTGSGPWLCASKALCACCGRDIALHSAALAPCSILKTGASSSKVPSGWQRLTLLCLLPSTARPLSPARGFPEGLGKGSSS